MHFFVYVIERDQAGHFVRRRIVSAVAADSLHDAAELIGADHVCRWTEKHQEQLEILGCQSADEQERARGLELDWAQTYMDFRDAMRGLR